jgi:hypothetical protein
MTRYKVFKITNKENKGDYIRFELNESVIYKDGNYRQIDCGNCYPFNNYYTDNYLEIDLDRTRYESYLKTFEGGEVRKYTATDLVPFQSASSSVAPSSFMSAVNNAHHSNQDYEAFIEQRDKRGDVIKHAFAKRTDGQFYDGFFKK